MIPPFAPHSSTWMDCLCANTHSIIQTQPSRPKTGCSPMLEVFDTASPSWFHLNSIQQPSQWCGRADTVTRDFSIMMRPGSKQ